MTPVEIRQTFNETISAFRRSWGDTAQANAKHVIAALDAHPWLMDQIPNDVHDMARRMAKGLPPVEL